MVAVIVRRRWFVAWFLAIILHLALMPFLPQTHSVREFRQPVQLVKILRLRHERRHQHRPHPVRKHHRIIARHISPTHGAKAAGRPRHTLHFRRAAAPPKITRRREVTKRLPSPSPVRMAKVPTPTQIEDRGFEGTEVAAPVVAGGGAGGAAQEGNGMAGAGNGTGEGEIPCGVPDLVRQQTRTIDMPAEANAGVAAQKLIADTIRATIHYPDGTQESALFPYPFTYRSYEEDPFDRRNRDNAQLLILVQRPPQAFDQNALPLVIRKILSRTSPEGISLFLPCADAHSR